MILIFGALLGFISVAFGAYAEHGLSKIVTDENFRFLMTAVRYNQVNSVVTVVIGLALLDGKKYSNLRMLKFSGLLFILGTALFSFSIYLSVSLNVPALVKITPLGGMTTMAAWFLLLVTGVFGIKKL